MLIAQPVHLKEANAFVEEYHRHSKPVRFRQTPGKPLPSGGRDRASSRRRRALQVAEQLTRRPRPLPRMKITPYIDGLENYRFSDFALENYDPYLSIKVPIAL